MKSKGIGGLWKVALFIGISLLVTGCKNSSLPEAFPENQSSRERSLLTDNWRFMKHDSAKEADDLIYDARLEVPGEDFPFVQTTLDDTSWERSIFHMIGLSRGYFLKVGVPVVIQETVCSCLGNVYCCFWFFSRYNICFHS